MSSSRTRSRLAVATMLLLAAMISGCVYPRMSRFPHTCERICIVSSVPSTLVTRHSAQHPMRHKSIDRAAIDTGPGDTGPGDTGPGEPRAVEVATDDAQAEIEAPVDVAAIPSGLTIDVVDLADPVPNGSRLTYKIIVRNDGTLPERNVSVVAIVPQGMIPIRTDTDGSSEQPFNGRALIGQIVRFDSVPQIGPGGQREYQVVVQTLVAGQQTLRVELTSDNLLQPLEAEATTNVLP